MAGHVTPQRELLRKLLTDFLGGCIDTQTFCSNFEHAFNFAVDRPELSRSERAAFKQLFDEVVYFSPFPEERAAIPNYRSEEQIRQAAEGADAALRTVR